jgi:hypothetical protein
VSHSILTPGSVMTVEISIAGRIFR